jgi:hypothetical protein
MIRRVFSLLGELLPGILIGVVVLGAAFLLGFVFDLLLLAILTASLSFLPVFIVYRRRLVAKMQEQHAHIVQLQGRLQEYIDYYEGGRQ